MIQRRGLHGLLELAVRYAGAGECASPLAVKPVPKIKMSA
jgi:hypothetical protein